jgi:hypothetical protein
MGPPFRRAVIHVSLTSLLILSMFAGLGLLGVLWLLAVWNERREERRSRRKVVLCRICGHIYDNPELKRISACPSCGSLNEVTQPRPI